MIHSSTVTGWILAAVVAAVSFPEFNRTPPTIVLKSELLTEKVAAGETFLAEVTVARLRICDAHLRAKMIDSEGNVFVYPPGIVEKSERNTYMVDRVVPSKLVPGPAVYQPDTTYACTTLQHYLPFLRLQRNDERIRFEIVERPKE